MHEENEKKPALGLPSVFCMNALEQSPQPDEQRATYSVQSATAHTISADI